MTHFDNAVNEMHGLSDRLDVLACEAHDGTLEPAELTDVSKEVAEMVKELEKLQTACREVLDFLDKASEVRL